VIKTIFLVVVGGLLGFIVAALLAMADAYRREHDEWGND